AERLDGAARAALRRRHAEHFLLVAEREKPALDGPGQAEVLDRLAAEHASFRAALDWAAEEGGDPALGIRLAIALQLFWHPLASARRSGDGLGAATALANVALVAHTRGDLAKADAAAREALAAARAQGGEVDVAHALTTLGVVASERGDLEGARALFEEALALARAVADRRWVATVGRHVAEVEVRRGAPGTARAPLEESL